MQVIKWPSVKLFKYKVKYFIRVTDTVAYRQLRARDILEATKLACVDKEIWVVSVTQED